MLPIDAFLLIGFPAVHFTFVNLALGMALEADLPEVLVRSISNPRSLLTLVFVGFYDNFALWT